VTGAAAVTGAARPVGVVLAGGRSQRMGGPRKALLPLGGRPLLAHVVARAGPQVSRLLLSVESRSPVWDGFGLQQLPDPGPGHRGPLGGLLSALRCLRGNERWLLLLPCDAPFIPLDLGARLLRCAVAADRPGAVVFSRGRLQPTFSVWCVDLLPRLERAVGEQGMGGFHEFLELSPLASLRWLDAKAGKGDGEPDGGPWPFFNINDPAALEQAGRWLNAGVAEKRACSV
jgi:molybdopterin-guanine dinucleotide biosynthesis protein A